MKLATQVARKWGEAIKDDVKIIAKTPVLCEKYTFKI